MKSIFFIIFINSFLFMSVSYGDNFNYYSDFSQNNVSKHLKDIAHHIAQQLNKSKNNEYIKTKTLAILSIVDIENLKKTSDLGKRIEDRIFPKSAEGFLDAITEKS